MKAIALLMLAIYFFLSEMNAPPKVQAKTEVPPEIVQLVVNGKSFDLTLAATPAAAEIRAMVPFTLRFDDHLLSEKYVRLPKQLPMDDLEIKAIQAGDLMLSQGHTLVLFYENSETNQHYTRLGKVNAEGLKSALGAGQVMISIQ